MPFQIGFGLIAGIAFVALLRAARRERILVWALPVLPLVYVAFQLADGNTSEALKELALGIPFIGGAVILARGDHKVMWAVAGVFWLAHAAFDLIHDDLVDGSAVPDWYHAVCIGFDVAVGAYLVWRQRRPVRVDL